MGSYKI